jgi:hypothetical protein
VRPSPPCHGTAVLPIIQFGLGAAAKLYIILPSHKPLCISS